MSISIYNINDHKDQIKHDTFVDFGGKRSVVKQVHLVQYDKNLPILLIKLYKNGSSYAVPTNADSLNIRWGKRDGTGIIRPVDGISPDRKTAYVEVDRNMSSIYGCIEPILELKINSEDDEEMIAGSSGISIIIDRNPVQDDFIESTSDYPELQQTIRELRAELDEVKKLLNI